MAGRRDVQLVLKLSLKDEMKFLSKLTLFQNYFIGVKGDL